MQKTIQCSALSAPVSIAVEGGLQEREREYRGTSQERRVPITSKARVLFHPIANRKGISHGERKKKRESRSPLSPTSEQGKAIVKRSSAKVVIVHMHSSSAQGFYLRRSSAKKKKKKKSSNVTQKCYFSSFMHAQFHRHAPLPIISLFSALSVLFYGVVFFFFPLPTTAIYIFVVVVALLR